MPRLTEINVFLVVELLAVLSYAYGRQLQLPRRNINEC